MTPDATTIMIGRPARQKLRSCSKFKAADDDDDDDGDDDNDDDNE